jgi:probable FeS assembly SUF system protein SufT
MSDQRIQLLRAVDAIRIPSGEKVLLDAGREVIVTQALGGSYTVATDYGLFRITSGDADALGFNTATAPGAAPAPAAETPGAIDEKIVWDQLKTCYDPEIPVNIVDLGLVYDCRVDGGSVEVKMTLTAPGCGMGPVICEEARAKIMTLPGVTDARVELVWDPPWNQSMISEVGRMQLGMV